MTVTSSRGLVASNNSANLNEISDRNDVVIAFDWDAERRACADGYKRHTHIAVQAVIEAARFLRRGAHAAERLGFAKKTFLEEDCQCSEREFYKLQRALKIWEGTQLDDERKQFFNLMTPNAFLAIMNAPESTIETAYQQFRDTKPEHVTRKLIDEIKERCAHDAKSGDLIVGLAESALDSAQQLKHAQAELDAAQVANTALLQEQAGLEAALKEAEGHSRAMQVDLEAAQKKNKEVLRASATATKSPTIGKEEQARLDELNRSIDAANQRLIAAQATMRKVEQQAHDVEEICSAIDRFIDDTPSDDVMNTTEGMSANDLARVRSFVARAVEHVKRLSKIVDSDRR
jgi:hypothetical protein